jgi:hypothetical protein
MRLAATQAATRKFAVPMKLPETAMNTVAKLNAEARPPMVIAPSAARSAPVQVIAATNTIGMEYRSAWIHELEFATRYPVCCKAAERSR